MPTRAQLNKAINNRIKGEFPSVPIQSSDVEEGFQRPSFFVSLETDSSDTGMSSMLRAFTCRILYFPSDRYVYKEEVYDIQDRLEKLFGLNFAVVDRTITIDTAESVVVDKVLHYDFNFSYYEEATDEDPGESGYKMQVMNYNG